MDDELIKTYERALDSYARIGSKTQVRVHDRNVQAEYLDRLVRDFQEFKDISLRGLKGAALRETKTAHGLEYLTVGNKATFEIENYLGGSYYLTADEIVQEGNKFIIQECKNASMSGFPSTPDIKDGLFKLILFSN